MTAVYWLLIIIMFAIAFAGLVFPVIPGVLFLAGGFLLYGVFFSFASFTVGFWIVELILTVLLFTADYGANWFGVKRSGGSKHAARGSLIGLIIGPFIFPPFGLLIGPFVGAFMFELLFHKATVRQSLKIGFATILAFLSGAFMKLVIQSVMIGYFFWVITK